METTATITARVTRTALDAFMSEAAYGEELAERIHTYLRDDFIDVGEPDDIHWGHVGDLQRVTDLLEQIADIVGIAKS